MVTFLLADENIAFVIALAIMVLVGVVELVGLGSAATGHDAGLEGDGDWLGWLGFGRLPLLMLLVVFLATFGVIGLIGQQLALDFMGALLSPWIAAPAAAVLALPATGLFARGLALILPGDETTAIDVDQLVGLHAEIVTGRAMRGSPARARVRDFHGQSHYVLAEPDSATENFVEGDEILLVARHGQIFHAIPSGQAPFTRWIKQ